MTATTVCDNQELEVVEEEALGELVPCQQSPTHPKQAAVVCPAAKTDAEDQLRSLCFGFTVRTAGGRPTGTGQGTLAGGR